MQVLGKSRIAESEIMSDIQIIGLEKIRKHFDAIEPALKTAIKAATLHVKGKVAKYPPSSEANIPFQRRWYERGWGSKWMIKNGTWHGNKSSEMLGRKWTIEMRNNGMEGVIGNNVNYGPDVQGGADAPHPQTAPLKRIGWKTTDEVAEEEQETVMRYISDAIEKALSR